MDDHDALENGLWEVWTGVFSMDWVPTEQLISAVEGLQQLFWVLYDAACESDTLDARNENLKKARKCYRHITTFVDAIQHRNCVFPAFEPHIYDRDGKPWPKKNKMKGLPPPITHSNT